MIRRKCRVLRISSRATCRKPASFAAFALFVFAHHLSCINRSFPFDFQFTFSFAFSFVFTTCSQQANGSASPAPQDLAPEVTGAEEAKEQASAKKLQDEEKEMEEVMTPEVMSALNKLGIDEAKDNRIFNPESSEKQKQRPSLLKSPSDYLPMIRRGFSSRFEEKEEEPVVSVGWQVEVRNRKEREEALRYVILWSAS